MFIFSTAGGQTVSQLVRALWHVHNQVDQQRAPPNLNAFINMKTQYFLCA